MKSKFIYQSTTNSSIVAETSDECRALAEKNPGNMDYRSWIQVLVIFEESSNV
jgi:hypothetical protein